MTQRLRTRFLLALFAGFVVACGGAPATSSHRTLPEPATHEPRTPATRMSEPTDSCEAQSFSVGQLHVLQKQSRDDSKCIVMISADETHGKARSFVFNSQGMLLTFGMLGPGSAKVNTGARTHFLLPNVQPLRVERAGEKVLVHTTSGHIVTFDASTGRPAGISGGEFEVTQEVTAEGGGGVTLRSSSGIIVDFGYTKGGSPHERPNGQATLTDGRGQTCTIQNRELLSYERDEPYLRVSSATELSDFLEAQQESCATLRASIGCARCAAMRH
jgi:hypothetical protein